MTELQHYCETQTESHTDSNHNCLLNTHAYASFACRRQQIFWPDHWGSHTHQCSCSSLSLPGFLRIRILQNRSEQSIIGNNALYALYKIMHYIKNANNVTRPSINTQHQTQTVKSEKDTRSDAKITDTKHNETLNCSIWSLSLQTTANKTETKGTNEEMWNIPCLWHHAKIFLSQNTACF